jgi:DNA-binding transcriptional ArsR family regulator
VVDRSRLPEVRCGLGGSLMATHEVFAALADPTRLRVLSRLAHEGPATATELAATMPISRQAVVKHLAALDAAELVEKERHGREVRYSFHPAPLGSVLSWVESVGGQWDDRLGRLRREFE